jgi:hypothetical protein
LSHSSDVNSTCHRDAVAKHFLHAARFNVFFDFVQQTVEFTARDIALHLIDYVRVTALSKIIANGGARPNFDEDTVGDPPLKKRQHGFMTGRIEFGSNGATIRC